MNQMRTTMACRIGLLLLGVIALCKGDPAPAAQSPSLNRQLETINGAIDEQQADKRAWQNLHGGWGKRAWQDMGSAWGKRAWQDMGSAWGKRAWQNLHGGWGKRGWQDMNSAWGKRAWKDMNSAWGKRTPEGSDDMRQRELLRELIDEMDKNELLNQLATTNIQLSDDDYYNGNYEKYTPLHQLLSGNADRFSNDADADEEVEKKSWSSLHGTWGKRSADKWSNLRGSWGKREPGWNNLKGLWGKRSVKESSEDSPSDVFAGRQEE